MLLVSYMKKSAEKKIKAQKAQLVDPIENAITKTNDDITPKDVKQFIVQLDRNDPTFHKDVESLNEAFMNNSDQEQKLDVMVNEAKKFNEQEVRVSRGEVADKLKPVIEKIVKVLGDNLTKKKLIYSIGYLLSNKTADGKESTPTKHNVTAIMKIYEERYGLPIKDKENAGKLGTHDNTKSTYDVKITDQELLDTMFNAYQSTRESGTFKELLIKIDAHYDVVEMTVVTI